MALLAKLFRLLKLCIANNTFRLDTMCFMKNLSKIAKNNVSLNLIINISVKTLNFTLAKMSTYTVYGILMNVDDITIVQLYIICHQH